MSRNKDAAQTGSQNGEDRLAGALAEWPLPQRTPANWDEFAADIVQRAESGSIGARFAHLTDEEILQAPGGQTPEDGHNSRTPDRAGTTTSAHIVGIPPLGGEEHRKRSPQTGERKSEESSMNSMDRERDRRSLQELAKLGAMTPSPGAIRPAPTPSGSDVMLPASRLEDSGVVDFGALSAPAPAVAPVAAPAASYPSPSYAPPGPSTYAATALSPVHPMTQSPMTVPLQAVAPSLAPSAYAPPSLPPPSAAVTGTMPLTAMDAQQASAVVSMGYGAPTSQAPTSLGSQISKKKSGRGGLIAITAILGIAAAAGGVLTVGKLRPGVIPGIGTKPVAVSVTPATPTPVAVATVATPPVTPVTPGAAVAPEAPVAAAAPAEKPADGSLDPMSLPVAGQHAATPHNGGATHSSHAAAAPAKAAPAAVAAAEKTEKAAPPEKAEKKDNTKASLFAQQDTAPAAAAPEAKKELQPATGDGTALGEAMRQAAGPAVSKTDRPDEPKKKAPDYAPGSVPQRPSQGAVSGALGNVLPNARACLGPDDPVSKATIIFASSGTVQSVGVHGAATGKPAEQCIKAALQHAKLPPFAESTYTANITIRH